MAEVSHNTWSKLVQLRATHWNLTFSASLKRKKKKKKKKKKKHNAVALKRTHTPFEHMPPLGGLSIGAWDYLWVDGKKSIEAVAKFFFITASTQLMVIL